MLSPSHFPQPVKAAFLPGWMEKGRRLERFSPRLPAFLPFLPQHTHTHRVSERNTRYNVSHSQKLGAGRKVNTGEFGSGVFWKRNPVFVLIFHLWENFCHRQFKGHAANIVSMCRYRGIYDFIESGQKVCGGSPPSGRGERDRFAFGGRERGRGGPDLFLFQMRFRPHMVLVFWPI